MIGSQYPNPVTAAPRRHHPYRPSNSVTAWTSRRAESTRGRAPSTKHKVGMRVIIDRVTRASLTRQANNGSPWRRTGNELNEAPRPGQVGEANPYRKPPTTAITRTSRAARETELAALGRRLVLRGNGTFVAAMITARFSARCCSVSYPISCDPRPRLDPACLRSQAWRH